MKGMEFSIRPLKKEEIPAVASVYSESFNQAGIGEEWTQEKAEEFMTWWFKHQPDLFFVAFYKEKLVGGIVAGIKPWWDGQHLVDSELFVHPDFQKQGIGKELVKTLLQEAIRKYKIVEFEGLADKTHEFPLSWYKKSGMKETDLVHISGKPKEILKRFS